ncbi:MAG: ribonuclease HII [Chloroflexota bacterium]|nr:ribonuclease HII [Chloroflexota bacterium]
MRPEDIAPTLDYEIPFWQTGSRVVAGVDEVGRGALAGPLVAAAVALPVGLGETGTALTQALLGVRDSKQLSPRLREKLLAQVLHVAACSAVGVVPPEELDVVGLSAANRIAMERAVLALPVPPDALLLDACIIDLGCPQVGIVDGDARCLSIAAASILAKVTRDRMMVDCHHDDPRYGFNHHKGYGTAAHIAALRKHGLSPLHRHSFACLPPAAP